MALVFAGVPMHQHMPTSATCHSSQKVVPMNCMAVPMPFPAAIVPQATAGATLPTSQISGSTSTSANPKQPPPTTMASANHLPMSPLLVATRPAAAPRIHPGTAAMMFQARQATSSKPGTTTAAHPGHPLNMMAVPMQPHSQTQPPLPPQQQQQHQQQQRMVAVPAASMPVVPAKMHATGTGISTSTGYVSQQAMQVVSAPAAMHSRLPTRACTAGVTSQRTISPKMAPSRQPPLVKTSTNTHPQLPGPHQLPTQMQPVPAPTLASTLSSGGSTMHSGLCNTPQVVQAPSLHQTGSRPILLGNRAQLQPQQQPQQQLKHSRRQRQAAKSLTSDVRRSQGNSVPRSFVPSVGLIYHPSQLPGRGGATLTATATSNSNGLPTPAAASAVAAAAPGPVALVPIARGHSPMPAWVAYPAVVPIASPRIRLRRPSVGAPVHVAQAPGPLIAKHQQLSQQPQQLQQQLQQQPHQHQQQQQQDCYYCCC
mmetsp:Transcript_82087/g.180421  ORF Transcript_82087/g.180421 Transcript_82087/m.180421 type:complete len:482 (-) Transcript_82087:2285-3730(-)